MSFSSRGSIRHRHPVTADRDHQALRGTRRFNPGTYTRRWQLFGVLATAVSLITAAAFALAPDKVQALQYAVRATARTSFVLFLAVFAASTLVKLSPSPLTKAIVRERRYVGLSFAYSHLLHAVALVVYVQTAPEAFWVGRTPATNIPGSLGYLAIVLLTVTSFATPARLIGPHNWKKLHVTGIWLLAIIFASSFLTRAPHHPGYLVPGVIMIAAMVLRVAVRSNKVPGADVRS